MAFDKAVQVNPSVPLERGVVYPFVDMQAVDPGSRSVGPSEMREFKGGGSRFMNGDTLMARITPCLENGKIARFSVREGQSIAHGSTEFIVIRGRPDVTDNGFAYYLTKWDGVRQYCISHMTGSSGRQRVPTDALSHREVTIPPMKQQQAIGCILGTLDDKIELNQQMNRTLEAMARAIFKSWFVDFDPVRAKAEGRDPGQPKHIADLFPDSFEDSELGEIPRGWRVGVVGDIATQAIGGQWGFDIQEDGLAPAVCLRGCDMEDLRNNGYAPKAPVRFVNPNAIEKRLPSDCDVLVGASGAGPCGRPLWFNSQIKELYELPVIYSNFVKRFTTPSPAYAIYLDRFLICKFQDGTIHDFITGTSVPNLDAPGLLSGCHLVLPPPDLLHAFFKLSNSIFGKLYSKQNILLAQTRDLLLPKLISGELSVPDAERIVGRCA